MYPFIEIFGRTIGTYGIMAAVGMLASALCCYLLLRKKEVDIEDVKSLEMLNPINIDNPAVYSILTAKYHKAANLGITMTIHVSLKLETFFT